MSNFNRTQRNPLELVTIIPDKKPHIFIKKDSVCARECENKPCTITVPQGYITGGRSIKVMYERCIECEPVPSLSL